MQAKIEVLIVTNVNKQLSILASEENMSSCGSLESRSEQLAASNSYPTLCVMSTEKDVSVGPRDQVDGQKQTPVYAKVYKAKVCDYPIKLASLQPFPSICVQAKKSDSSPPHPPPLPPPIAPGDIPKQNGTDLDLPPPLPPPIAPGDIPKQNGTEAAELKGLVLVPHIGNGMKARRPVPLPRAHVYELVPDGIRMVRVSVIVK